MCMHLYLKMYIVFENMYMYLYSNTTSILIRRHALIFEHEITMIKKCYDNYSITLLSLIYHLSMEMSALYKFI